MRYATTQTLPPQPTIEGDDGFIGENSKLDRALLQPGYCAQLVNKRLIKKVAEKRPGTITPVFANVESFSSIVGSGVYSNPNGDEAILIATGSNVRQIQSGRYPRTIPIPAGETLLTADFVQAFDKLLMFRGLDVAPLVWDGVSTAGFAAVTKFDPADTSTTLIPKAETAVSFLNRILIPLGKDGIAVSDILDYTSYDPTLENFRVNFGTSDPIVRLFPYAQGSVIVGKAESIDLIANFTDTNHPETATAQLLSSTVGTNARRSWAMVGGDVFFLYRTGVYRINQVIQDRLEASPVPVSDSIEGKMARINWLYATGAVAAVLGPYYFLAVPIDGSKVNNAVLVYNTVTKEWEGHDTWNTAGNMQIDNLLVSDYFGRRALYAVNHAAKAVHILYEGKDDELANGTYPVSDLIETRGYATLGWNASTKRDFKRVEIPVFTWNPSITVSARLDDAGDDRLLTPNPITKTATKYQQWGKTDFVPTNANDDADLPGREDYSVFVDDVDGVDVGSNGMDVEQKQQSTLRFSTKLRGRYVSYKIASTQGSCDVGGCLVESVGAQRELRRAA